MNDDRTADKSGNPNDISAKMLNALENIDVRTAEILDALTHGVTGGGYIGRTIVKQGKDAAKSKAVEVKAIRHNEKVTKVANQKSDSIQTDIAKSNRAVIEALLSEPTVSPKVAAAPIVRNVQKPQSNNERRAAAANTTKSQTALESKKQSEILERIGEKQQSAIASTMKKAIDTLKSGASWAAYNVGHQGDLQDAVGLGIGGPIYGVMQEMSGIFGDLKDRVGDLMGKLKKESPTKKPEKVGTKSNNRDEKGRFVAQQQAMQKIQEAVTTSDKHQRESSRKVIDALLAESKPVAPAPKAPSRSLEAFQRSKTNPPQVINKTTSKTSFGGAFGVKPAGQGGGGSWLDTIESIGGGVLSGGAGAILASGKAGLKTFGKGALKALGGAARIAGKAAGPLAVLTTAIDAIQGFRDTEEAKQIFGTSDVTTGQRAANAVATVIDMGGVTSAITKAIGVGFDKAATARSMFDWGKWFLGKIPKDATGEVINPMDTIIGGMDRSTESLPTIGDVFRKHFPKIQDTSTLGAVSAKEESGKLGAGAVSTGKGDVGEASYGTYQLSSKGGDKSSVSNFVRRSKWIGDFYGLRPGSPEFNAKWKEIAAREPEEFAKAQHEFIADTHYKPLVQNLSRKGIDLSDRSRAVQEALWSRAVQHGAGGATEMIRKALEGKDVARMSDEDIIRSIYDESAKRKSDGNLAYFSGNARSIQEGVAKRLPRERDLLIAMARKEHEPSVNGKRHMGSESVSEITPPPPGPDYQGQLLSAVQQQTSVFQQLNSRPKPPQQADKPAYNIPMEFDDALLTLMAYDRI